MVAWAVLVLKSPQAEVQVLAVEGRQHAWQMEPQDVHVASLHTPPKSAYFPHPFAQHPFICFSRWQLLQFLLENKK